MDVTEIWQEYADSHSSKSRDKLILNYMPLVKRLARQIHNRLPSSVDLEDLISYGTFGLIDAIEKFELARGLKFETYSPQRITGAIYDGMRKMDWVPRNERSQSRNLDETTTGLAISLQRPATDQEIADQLGWDVEKVRQAQSEQHRHFVMGLDQPVSFESEGEPTTLVDILSDGLDTPASELNFSLMKDRLASAIVTLEEREQAVLVLYYFEKLKFAEIGELFNVSESRICQIHMKAVEDMRSQLTAGIS